MVVRGAPAIGVTGALALAVHLISGGRGKQYASVQACLDDVASTMDYLVTRWGGQRHSSSSKVVAGQRQQLGSKTPQHKQHTKHGLWHACWGGCHNTCTGRPACATATGVYQNPVAAKTVLGALPVQMAVGCLMFSCA